MKRAIAICLLVICIALPLISYASGLQCPHCKKSSSIPINYSFFYTPYNSTSHTTYARILMYCTNCRNTFTSDCEIAKDPHRNPTHYRQVIGLHLVYEYDVCGDCGDVYNTHTSYN
ncbi:hypothetical protein JS518_06685 [Clostridiales bacterium FE2010]|nr:hypothetical protein JS518_06685 [Clostridiales bacterium FE2010]